MPSSKHMGIMHHVLHHPLLLTVVVLLVDMIRIWYSTNRSFFQDVDLHCYRSFMQQYVVEGERRYQHFTCDYGRAFYPAGFFHVYAALWWISGDQLSEAFMIAVHALVTLVTNSLVLQILGRNTVRSGAHRLIWFVLIVVNTQTVYKMGISYASNDAFGTLMAVLMLVGIERKWYWLASAMFAASVSFKMSALLYGPLLLLVYLHSLPFIRVVVHFAAMGVFQMMVALPFLMHDWRSYIRIAFNFGRDFNNSTNIAWTFLGDTLRQNEYFYKLLFLCTIGFLLAFMWMAHMVLSQFAPLKQHMREIMRTDHAHAGIRVIEKYETEWKLFVMTAANLMNFIFVRGIHPQFSAWIFFSLPFVLYLTIVRQPQTMGLELERAFHIGNGEDIKKREESAVRDELSLWRWFKMVLIYFVLDWCLAHHRHVLRFPKLLDGVWGLMSLDMDALFDSDAFFGRLGAFDWVKIGIFNSNFNAGVYQGDYYRELGYLWREHFSLVVWPASLVLFIICCHMIGRIFQYSHKNLVILRNMQSKTKRLK